MNEPCMYTRMTGNNPRERGDKFGIEVEVEYWDEEVGQAWDQWVYERGEIPVTNRGGPPEELADVVRYWTITTDGSLRHRGMEFVSMVLSPHEVSDAVGALWRQVIDTGYGRETVRTGIHVHCNAGHWPASRLRKFLQFYLLAEPLLFQKVGDERWHNIYCIPLLLAKDETRRLRAFVSAQRGGQAIRRELNKYSALYVGPIGTHGTVEFRHAPTFEVVSDMLEWMRMVGIVYRGTIGCPADLTVPAVVAYMQHEFRDVPGLDWVRYAESLEKYDAIGEALSLEPCTYKAKLEWGQPASLQFERTPAPEYADWSAIMEQEQEEVF